jgi:hypothetical protein
MSRKNNLLGMQQPAPLYANDPDGYWSGIYQENARAGLSSLLPTGTLIQSDVSIKGRLLAAQISWQPVSARWNGKEFQVSLADTPFALDMENGGVVPNGTIAVQMDKSTFAKFPIQGDQVDLRSASNQWVPWNVVTVEGQHDPTDPGLLLVMKQDDATYDQE